MMPQDEDQTVKIWAEDDEFTQLLTKGTTTLSHLVIIRTYCRALSQMGLDNSPTDMAEILANHPEFIQTFCGLFCRRFDPSIADSQKPKPTSFHPTLFQQLHNLLTATVRTNFYQRDANGRSRPYLSLKFDCQKIDGLPDPKPLYEIFVYSPRVEGYHLRSALIGRGGIRWSSRLQDYRSEILQLMKTQTMKNAIIVPSGAKGGFICKKLAEIKTPDQRRQEGKECYEIFIKGLLDLTDNVDQGKTTHPLRTVFYDQDDPYLVVAADKGTANFSDLSNAISKEYNFWLGDAFASGGSHGYNHKQMGITARGAWIAVQRHFQEMGIDCQSQPITVVGIGDMSGDVFGNGMLQSSTIHLVAAFDHRHIFLDPNPDPFTAYNERLRLFNLPDSSWADYGVDVLSQGGGVYDRNESVIVLSKEVCGLLKIDPAKNHTTPTDLIQMLLKAPVDLLWFGGVGTFVKSSIETHKDAQDPSNDAIRVNADRVQARVMGEGANLAITQRGRVEYALMGGRLNTDAIDNSAGVDCSDREVNLKILFLTSGISDYDHILAQTVSEVMERVLADNNEQTLILSLESLELKDPGAIQTDLKKYQDLIQFLEGQPALHFDRHLEKLPTAQDFEKRCHLCQALTRPERAVVMAYAKIYLAQQILKSFQKNPSLPTLFQKEYESYFPSLVVERFKESLNSHPLRLEITSTALANKIVNDKGPSWCIQTAQTHGIAEIDVVLEFLKISNEF
ncbi:NAD-glutamate dehydrogenase domain-containing protein [Candidatus Finniella inopinata]|uniref:Uncharacterized protein n=1 Tax=Candidatus Finniella inopinata TaxID=1696036 RepID=A0A4Q7DGB7_9PROT|nr:NAD-glutamate dehydrogenase domain-containing protein [Candidatus Finniella inopinata]RZI45843.1 hypothetical protein EQU50_05255 [Candidatus Finniella inopinata]